MQYPLYVDVFYTPDYIISCFILFFTVHDLLLRDEFWSKLMVIFRAVHATMVGPEKFCHLIYFGYYNSSVGFLVLVMMRF